MHPRSNAGVPAEGCGPWPRERIRRADLLLEFIRERGAVHPREVDDHFSHGAVKNYWGGSSNATTHLMEAMHYRGMLRVVRREGGSPNLQRPPARRRARRRGGHAARASTCSPTRRFASMRRLPGKSLLNLVRRLRYAVPQWSGDLTAAQKRAKERLSHARIDGVDWYWPAEERGATGHRAGTKYAC